jgi:ABC-type uncharacterized transport system fused permease/ATPase subunit
MLMNRVTTRTIHIEKAVFMSLASLTMMLFALYIYFISASVVHVVMRTEIDQEITKLASDISELEGKYIEAQHRVSSDIASLQGYTQTQAKVFIDKTPTSLVLSTPLAR